MPKSILAIIVSYAAGILLFFAIVSGGFFLLGVERVFQPFSYEISSIWLALTLVVSLLSAMFAGYVCALISKSWRICQVLAFVAFFLTLISCVLDLRRINPDAPNTRAGEVEYFDAMKLAVTPRWLHFVNPVISGVGILLGARMKRRGNT